MSRYSERIQDELLVLRCQEGDGAAFEDLVERWQERLWRHAWRLTGNEDAAWDVLQEAWMGIARGIRRLEDAAAFPAWAYRIVSNKCRDWIRRERRRREVHEAYSENIDQEEDDHCETRERCADLKEALARLPAVARRQMAEPEDLVEAIIDALARGKRELTFPRWIASGYVAQALAPSFFRAR